MLPGISFLTAGMATLYTSSPDCDIAKRFIYRSTIGGLPFSCAVAKARGAGAASLNILERERGIETEYLFELVHILNLRAHRDIGDSLDDELEHDRYLVFLH